MNTTAAETHTVVIGSVYVGNGTKQHIAEVTVFTEIKFGQERTAYSRPSVGCGSARWGRGGFSSSHSVAEISDRIEIAADASFLQRIVALRSQAGQAVNAMIELAGENACEKCVKEYRRIAELQEGVTA